MEKFLKFLKTNKKIILKCLCITFILGLIAHGFMFVNSNLTHDSFLEFLSTKKVRDWKISLGRVFWPGYQFLTRGFVTAPWLIGIVSLFYLSIVLFLIIKIFDIDEKNNFLIALIGGILTVNITIISLCAVYINDMDADILALLLSVLSVYLWKKHDKGYLYGIIPLALSIGLYQSYISVCITLIIIYSIIQLLNFKDENKVLKKGLNAVLMIILSVGVFWVSMKAIQYATNVTILSGKYNSMDTFLSMSFTDFIKNTIVSYKFTIKEILYPSNVFPKLISIIIHSIPTFVAGVILIKRMFHKDIKIKSRLLIVILLLLLPFAMNICRILTNGMSHDLMHFSLWLTYVFILLIIYNYKIENIFSKISICLVIIMLIGNFRLSNTIYLFKNINNEANLSFFTRLLYSIESNEDYIPEETKIAFVGYPINFLNRNVDEYSMIDGITGLQSSYLICSTDPNRYKLYFDKFLYTNLNVIEEKDIVNNNLDIIDKMSIYPNKDSIKMINDILVVKLGD